MSVAGRIADSVDIGRVAHPPLIRPIEVKCFGGEPGGSIASPLAAR
jgi:hypothetical protein